MTVRAKNCTGALTLRTVETFELAARPASPAKSALGDLTVRSALLVRLTDVDGAQGWGEVWCNFPPSGAAHRARLIREIIFPSIEARAFDGPAEMFETLTDHWRIMAHHTGETGPFTNAIAGLDIAAWDLVARRAGLSIAQAVGLNADTQVPVYASSPNPDRIEAHLDEVMADGHRAVKLKVGYGPERDDPFVAAARQRLGDDIGLMVDVNQSWSPDEAIDRIATMAKHRLDFVEEPIAGFLSASDWGRVQKASAVAVAGGENIPDPDCLDGLAQAGGIKVFQPSITKFGGVSGWLPRVERARASGIRVCPHYMGTAVGLSVSLQLHAATPEPGRHELDANDNPLRTDLGKLDLTVTDGRVAAPLGPGLGFVPEPDEWLVDQQ